MTSKSPVQRRARSWEQLSAPRPLIEKLRLDDIDRVQGEWGINCFLLTWAIDQFLHEVIIIINMTNETCKLLSGSVRGESMTEVKSIEQHKDFVIRWMAPYPSGGYGAFMLPKMMSFQYIFFYCRELNFISQVFFFSSKEIMVFWTTEQTV